MNSLQLIKGFGDFTSFFPGVIESLTAAIILALWLKFRKFGNVLWTELGEKSVSMRLYTVTCFIIVLILGCIFLTQPGLLIGAKGDRGSVGPPGESGAKGVSEEQFSSLRSDVTALAKLETLPQHLLSFQRAREVHLSRLQSYLDAMSANQPPPTQYARIGSYSISISDIKEDLGIDLKLNTSPNFDKDPTTSVPGDNTILDSDTRSRYRKTYDILQNDMAQLDRVSQEYANSIVKIKQRLESLASRGN